MDIDKVNQHLFNALHRFDGAENTPALFDRIGEIIPTPEENTRIINVKGTTKKFKATIELNIESVDKFLEDYSAATSETLRVKTVKHPGEKSDFKTIHNFRCQHKTFHEGSMNAAEKVRKRPSKRLKNTDCPFHMSVKERRLEGEYRFQLNISYDHNHPTKAFHALTFRDLSTDIVEKITNLFAQNHTPALAHRQMRKSLQQTYQEKQDFQVALADRSIMPSRRDFNNLFTEYKRKKFGSKDVPTMCAVLKEKMDEIISIDGNYSFHLNEFSEEENEPLILIIVSPVMKRVHEKVSVFMSHNP